MNRYEYLEAIQDILDDSCNNLSPEAFDQLKDDIQHMLDDYD